MSLLPKKSEATTDQKTVISLPHGRMVILEELDEETADVPTLIEMVHPELSYNMLQEANLLL